MSAASWQRTLAGQSVLVTGHTGFKGAWLSLWLKSIGARVHGLALPPDDNQRMLFEAITPGGTFASQHFLDVRDAAGVMAVFNEVQPSAVLHLAAQPLVRRSYADPAETFSVNVMGLVNVLEAVRLSVSVKAVVSVTSDKCYEKRERGQPYKEGDHLGGHDPYSASKAAAEIVTASYSQSFFAGTAGIACASARAGNVVGGGDFSTGRIVPDYIRAQRSGTALAIRMPNATRPWQHVLEPAGAYLLLAARLLESGSRYGGAWNFGPGAQSGRTVMDLVATLRAHTGASAPPVEADGEAGPQEAGLLNLDTEKAREELGWSPRLRFDEMAAWTMAWYLGQQRHPEGMKRAMLGQIEDYCSRTDP